MLREFFVYLSNLPCRRFPHIFAMMSKAEILAQLPNLPKEDIQEIFDRLCDLQAADASGLHQQWVDEAFQSGPALPGSEADWEEALRKGLARAEKAS